MRKTLNFASMALKSEAKRSGDPSMKTFCLFNQIRVTEMKRLNIISALLILFSVCFPQASIALATDTNANNWCGYDLTLKSLPENKYFAEKGKALVAAQKKCKGESELSYVIIENSGADDITRSQSCKIEGATLVRNLHDCENKCKKVNEALVKKVGLKKASHNAYMDTCNACYNALRSKTVDMLRASNPEGFTYIFEQKNKKGERSCEDIR